MANPKIKKPFILLTLFFLLSSTYKLHAAEIINIGAVNLKPKLVEINEISKNLTDTGQALVHLSFDLKKSTKTYLEEKNIDEQSGMLIINKNIFTIGYICFLEGQSLVYLFNLNSVVDRIYFRIKRNSFKLSKMNIETFVDEIARLYPLVTNISTLHLLDKAKDMAKTLLKNIDRLIELLSIIENTYIPPGDRPPIIEDQVVWDKP